MSDTILLVLPQFFEAACQQAQIEYEADNTNAQASCRGARWAPEWPKQRFMLEGLFCASQALVRWGGALLELAHLKQGSESTEMIHQVRAGCLGGGPELDLFRSELTPAPARRAQCISKLQKSLEINSDQAEASWCLGNAYTSLVRGPCMGSVRPWLPCP